MVKLLPRELVGMKFPEARFLNEEEQARYEASCQSYGQKARDSFDIPIKGSNLFKVLKLNEIGIRTATLNDLELALENGMDLSETFEDVPAVVLRSAGDSYSRNDYVAKSLAALTKKKSFPHAVVIEGLKPKEDSLSDDYGLSFEEGENFKIIEAPAFDHVNDKRRFDRINPDYTIEFNDKGKRTLHTREGGVSRLCLDRNLDLDSNFRDLDDSYDAGRVVVISDEATAQKILAPYLIKLQAERDRQIKEIEERYAKAEAQLKAQ